MVEIRFARPARERVGERDAVVVQQRVEDAEPPVEAARTRVAARDPLLAPALVVAHVVLVARPGAEHDRPPAEAAQHRRMGVHVHEVDVGGDVEDAEAEVEGEPGMDAAIEQHLAQRAGSGRRRRTRGSRASRRRRRRRARTRRGAASRPPRRRGHARRRGGSGAAGRRSSVPPGEERIAEACEAKGRIDAPAGQGERGRRRDGVANPRGGGRVEARRTRPPPRRDVERARVDVGARAKPAARMARARVRGVK